MCSAANLLSFTMPLYPNGEPDSDARQEAANTLHILAWQ